MTIRDLKAFEHCAVLVTLGPASREVDQLVKLLEAGTTCVRVDLTVVLLVTGLIVEILSILQLHVQMHSAVTQARADAFPPTPRSLI